MGPRYGPGELIMRDVYYKNGALIGSTLTVQELIAILDEYSDDTPVLITWEGQHITINPDDLELNTDYTSIAIDANSEY